MSEEQTVTIRIKIPDKTTPGFARRMHRIAGFQERQRAGEFSAKLVEEMVELLADFVEGERETAKEYLWDCSQEQFESLLNSVSGGDAAQIPPA